MHNLIFFGPENDQADYILTVPVSMVAQKDKLYILKVELFLYTHKP